MQGSPSLRRVLELKSHEELVEEVIRLTGEMVGLKEKLKVCWRSH